MGLSDLMLRWLIGGGDVIVAVLATACTALISPARTYYPLLRVIFALTAGVYAASAAIQYYGPTLVTVSQIVRLFLVAAAVGVLVFCVLFVVRRNTVPVWVVSDLRKLRGTEAIDWNKIEGSLLIVLSLLRHGAASRDMTVALREALAEWERREEDKAGLLLEAAARKKTRRAIREAHARKETE